MNFGESQVEFESSLAEAKELDETTTDSEADPESLAEAIERTTFPASEEMEAIETLVREGRETLTVELYTAYQIAGEKIADSITEGDPALYRLELQWRCAYLLVNGGVELESVAAENLEDLMQTPEMDQYPFFGTKVRVLSEVLKRRIEAREQSKN